MLRDEVLALLKAREGKPLSGEEMSRALGVSRAAVWKAMESLRDEGYVISSAPRRGDPPGGAPAPPPPLCCADQAGFVPNSILA